MSAKLQVQAELPKHFSTAVHWLTPLEPKVHRWAVAGSAVAFAQVQIRHSTNHAGMDALRQFRPKLTSVGWWTFDPKEIKASSAQVWILIQNDTRGQAISFLILPKQALWGLLSTIKPTAAGKSNFYWYKGGNGSSFQARDLGVDDKTRFLNEPFSIPAAIDLGGYENENGWHKAFAPPLQPKKG